jgi:hypothetical protein
VAGYLRRKNNIKLDFKELWCEHMCWSNVDPNGPQRRAGFKWIYNSEMHFKEPSSKDFVWTYLVQDMGRWWASVND